MKKAKLEDIRAEFEAAITPYALDYKAGLEEILNGKEVTRFHMDLENERIRYEWKTEDDVQWSEWFRFSMGEASLAS